MTGATGNRTSSPLYALALCAIAALVFRGGLFIGYYSDDFQFFFDPPPAHPLAYFYTRNPNNTSVYRPIEATFLAWVQQRFGLLTLPIHLTQIALHVLISWAISVWLTREGFSRAQSAIAALFMLVSQANVHAVLSNDTLSQVAAALFGYPALWAALHLRELTAQDTGRARVHAIMGPMAFALSLLSKETGIAFLPMVALIMWPNRAQIEHPMPTLKRHAARLVPYLLVLALYFAVRAALGLAGPRFDVGRNDFRIGMNVPLNLALFSFQALSPFSSVGIYAAFQMMNTAAVAAASLVVVALGLTVAYGNWRSDRWRGSLVMVVLAALGLVPAVFLNHVSELYLYNSMPLASMVVGVGLGHLLDRAGSTRGRWLVGLSLVCLFAAQMTAAQSKASLMRDNGERSSQLIAQVASFLREVPENGRVVLVNPRQAEPDYSVFIMNGFNVLDDGLHRLLAVSRRPDISITITDESRLRDTAITGDLVLGLETPTNRVVVYGRR